MTLTKKQAETLFKETHKTSLNTNDIPLKRMLWNDFTDALHKDGKITDTQVDTWSQPAFLTTRQMIELTNNPDVNKAIAAIRKKDTFRENDILDRYDSYEITSNGLTANIFATSGEGFQVVITPFESHRIGDITN